MANLATETECPNCGYIQDHDAVLKEFTLVVCENCVRGYRVWRTDPELALRKPRHSGRIKRENLH